MESQPEETQQKINTNSMWKEQNQEYETDMEMEFQAEVNKENEPPITQGHSLSPGKKKQCTRSRRTPLKEVHNETGNSRITGKRKATTGDEDEIMTEGDVLMMQEAKLAKVSGMFFKTRWELEANPLKAFT